MNNFRLLFSLVLSCLLIAPVTNYSAQTAKINTQPKSPGNLGTYSSNTFPIYSGNLTVGKGMKVYLTADTSGGVNTFSWTITTPAGSSTTLSSTSSQNVTFIPDTKGPYIVSLKVGSSSDADTFWVSTYVGPTTGIPNCSLCHSSIYSNWQQTGHAQIFQDGITGQLEPSTVKDQLVGSYGTSCVKCHTTGWDQTANNGNFGYLAHQNGFDTTWYKSYKLSSSEYQIPTNSQTAWNLLTTDSVYSNLIPVASIGCESCHGPGADHIASYGDASKISLSLNAGVCLQCHDDPTHHMIGAYYNASNHATMPLAGSEATSTSCFPCHSGSAYFKYSQNQSTPVYSLSDASQDITCAACHDPHISTNYGLRLVSVTLKNGYTVSTGGNGQLCMTCHQARVNTATYITTSAPYYGFTNRFGPHHGPQSDMLLGQNAYQYGDSSITGLNTHAGLTDACVTCHMQTRGPNSNHQWNMSDSTGDYVTICKSCHGQSITKFDDIKASADWDGNGKIEGVQTEVQGLLNKLAALLPKDGTGAVVSMLTDSLKVKGRPNIVQGIYTYYFVTSDGSLGIHNANYTVAILQKALNALKSPTGVQLVKNLPQNFVLSQNYPNPFNPSTVIQYTLPYASNVTLTVYNITGQVINVLVNSAQTAGVHQTIMNATSTRINLSSGIYFYSIQATSLDGSHSFRETKKMVLMK
ncbi:MAG: multiheme c-type cytochrome [Ignavibacteriaceae bacterium]